MDNGGVRAFGVIDCRMYLAIRLYSCMLSTDSKFIASSLLGSVSIIWDIQICVQ